MADFRAPLKGSRYLLISPQRYLTENGEEVRMAYATRSARVITLAETTAGHLARGELGLIPEADLAALVQAEALVAEDEDEIATVLSRFRTGSADMSVRQITIMPTSYCNMACSYCGQEHFKAAADAGRIARLARRVQRVIADPGVRSVRVNWFGGEPLLALRVIRELSEGFVDAASTHDVAYTATMATNGSLLTRRTLQLLHDTCRLRSIDVTLDGPAQLHDERRLKKNGRGSFHHVTAVLAEAIRDDLVPDLRINVRTNVDANNEDAVADLYYDLACMGFGTPQVYVSLVPVHSWGNDVSAVEVGAREYAAREAGWLALAYRLGLQVSFLPALVRSNTCLATSRHGELLDTAGRVYSCSEHPLVPQADATQVVARIEELTAGLPRPSGQFDDWYSSVAAGEVPCKSCPLLPVCGGRCPKLWREGHVPCPSMKHNWPERLSLAAAERGYRPLRVGSGV
jgi:uncharacterized protein